MKGQAGEILARKKRREEKISGELYPSIFSEDSDETFSFIAGYTSGGCPYGITWEETENFEHDAACENDHLFRKSE